MDSCYPDRAVRGGSVGDPSMDALRVLKGRVEVVVCLLLCYFDDACDDDEDEF